MTNLDKVQEELLKQPLIKLIPLIMKLDLMDLPVKKVYPLLAEHILAISEQSVDTDSKREKATMDPTRKWRPVIDDEEEIPTREDELAAVERELAEAELYDDEDSQISEALADVGSDSEGEDLI